jgi:hypothetical protein
MDDKTDLVQMLREHILHTNIMLALIRQQLQFLKIDLDRIENKVKS